MHQLAEKLNAVLDSTCVGGLLSNYGRRMYVPKGIIVQSAEAKKQASRFNATIGVALEEGSAMCLSSIKDFFSPSLKIGEIFPYAPMGGVPALRSLWKERMFEKNPSMAGACISTPVVAAGLTNALSLVCSLFLDEGDSVVLPNMYWENYDLILDEQRQAKKVLFDNFSFSKEGVAGFNVSGLDAALASTGDKAVVILNFPNNPTGYTPTNEEALEIVEVLKRYSNSGKKLVVVTDDAYFGLFFEKDVCKESLFARLCNCSENLLAVKCDAATKEEMVWGFRVAFITYGCKGFTEEQYDALVQKTMGALRGTLSCCSTSAQNILVKGMTDPSYYKEKSDAVGKIKLRYDALKASLSKYEERKDLIPLPFNSGYFMSFECSCNADELRHLLLDKYGTGVIRLDDHHIRLAFSSVDLNDITALIDTVYIASAELK